MNFTHTQFFAMVVVIGITVLNSCTCDSETFVRQTPALLVTSPDQIDFGEIPIGFDVTRRLTLLNEGQFPLEIEALNVIPETEPFDTEGGTFTIKAEQELEVVVHFRPTQERAYQAELTVLHSGFNDDEDVVLLKGVGIADTVCTACGGVPPDCLDENTQVIYEYLEGCEEDQCLYEATQVNCECGCIAATGQCRLCAGQDAGTLIEDTEDAGAEPFEPEGEPLDGGPVECMVVGGMNTSDDYNDDVSTGDKWMAWRYTAPEAMIIHRAEIFTGEATASSRVSLWSHDAAGNQPNAEIAGGDFDIVVENGWKGADFSASVSLTTAETYWLVWDMPSGAQASRANGGVPVSYRGSYGEGEPWDGLYAGPDKFRLYHCE